MPFVTAAQAARNSSYTASCTMNRSAATQFWPHDWNAARSAVGTTSATRASPHTMNGSLPPSSRVTGVSASAASRITARPTPVLPIKMTLSTPPRTSARPVSAPPAPAQHQLYTRQPELHHACSPKSRGLPVAALRHCRMWWAAFMRASQGVRTVSGILERASKWLGRRA